MKSAHNAIAALHWCLAFENFLFERCVLCLPIKAGVMPRHTDGIHSWIRRSSTILCSVLNTDCLTAANDWWA